MAAPSFVQASTGGTDAGGAWSATCSFTPTAGNVIIFQLFIDGSTTFTYDFTAGVENLNATFTPDMTDLPRLDVGASVEGGQKLWIGRALGDTPPVVSGTNDTSVDFYWRWYEFTNVSTGTTLATVIENIGGTSDLYLNGVGTSATVADSAVTTDGPDRLALNFVAVNDDNAITAFTGETGGDWTLAVAPYAESSGTDGAIGLQIATITTAATINGGTGTITDSDAWGVVGFALIGTTVVDTTRAPHYPAIVFQDPAIV